MLKFSCKAGVAAGACYYMAKEGVWQESEQSLKVYNKLGESIKPLKDAVSSQIPIEFPNLPSSERVTFLATHYWNAGVTGAFGFLQNLPEHMGRLGGKGMQLINSNEELKKLLHSFSSEESNEEKPVEKKKS